MVKQTLPSMVGRYQLLEPLGSTGVLSLHRAQHLDTGREVVVKVLSSYFASEEALVQRFFREVEQVRKLDHPNILSPLETGVEDGHYWIAVPYISWPTLRDSLQGKPLPLGASLGILRQVADALHSAHRQGILHKNLQPINVFLGPEGRALVADFGLATLAEGMHSLMRSTLSTPLPAYTAPEQTQGLPLDPRSDQYSLGVLAYELLTGRVPFSSLAAPVVLAKQLTQEPPQPSTLNPALPKDVDHILLRALARRPEGRYGSTLELVRQLEEALSRQAASPAPASPASVSDEGKASLPGQVPVQEELLYCPACGESNPPGALNCRSCWARLTPERSIGGEEAAEVQRGRGARRRRARWMRFTLLALAAVALAAYTLYAVVGTRPFLPSPTSLVSSESAPGEWAMLGRDPGRTGFIPDVPLLQGRLLWEFKTQAPLLASPVVSGGRVFLPTGDRRIVALDPQDGRLLWEAPTTGPVDSSPAVADGLVYVGLRDGRLLALDAATGGLQWSFQTKNPILNGPLVHQGLVYVASGDGFLYALDAKTGKQRWAYYIGGWLLASPALGNGVIVVSSSGGSVHLVDAATGRHRTHVDTFRPIQGTPVVAGSRAYVPMENLRAANASILVLDLGALEYPFERAWRRIRVQLFLWAIIDKLPVQKGLLWGTSFGKASSQAGPALRDDTLYVGTVDGNMHAFDVGRRERRWQFKTGGAIISKPAVAGESVYVGSSDGRLYALDARTGEKRWEFATQGVIADSPVVAGGTLYVPSRDGSLYALR